MLESNTLDFIFLKDGEQGVPGDKGVSLYTWVKYSKNADGSNMTDDPDGAVYIGLAYNKESSIESTEPSDYNWTKILGNSGENAYSVILQNENISFATDDSRTPLSEQSCTCDVIVMEGSTIRTDFTIDSLTEVTGISSSITDKTITLSVSPSSTLMSDSGDINVLITIDGITFSKIITYSISKQGKQGDDGLSAKSLDLYSSTYAVAFNSDGSLKDASDIILVANQQNFEDEIIWSTTPSVVLGVVPENDNQRTLSASIFSSNNQIQIKIQSGDLFDIVTIVKVQDGEKGDDGTGVNIIGTVYTLENVDEYVVGNDNYILYSDAELTNMINNPTLGDAYLSNGYLFVYSGNDNYFMCTGKIQGEQGVPGEDAYTIILSNESHTFVGDTSSAIDGSTICEVIAYKGTEKVNVTIGEISGLPNGMTAPISNNGSTNVYFSPTVTASMTTQNGILTIPIVVDGIMFTKYFTYTLALKGDEGVSVETVEVLYYLSTSALELSDGSWLTERPTWEDGKYIWSKQKTTLSNGKSSETEPVCITGAKGETGNVGQGVESLTPQYYLSTSKTTPTGGSWVEMQPSWEFGKYVWTRTKIVYKNPTATEYTEPVCDTTWEAMQSQIDTVKESVQNVQLQVDENKKEISLKASQSDIENSINNYDGTTIETIRDTVAEHTTSIGNITSKVSEVETQVAKKADGSTVQTLSEKVTTMEQDSSSFKTTVEETYATKSELENTSSSIKSEWTQKAGEIEQKVSDTDGKVSTLTNNLSGITQRVEDAEGNISSLQTGVGEIQAEIKDARGGQASLKLKVDELSTDISNANGIASSAKQTAESVQIEITNAKGDSTTLKARLEGIETEVTNAESNAKSYTNQKANEITASVSQTYATKQSVENVQTQVNQNTQDITLRVTKEEAQNYATNAKTEAINTASDDATNKANNAEFNAKSYTDSQIKISSDSITQTVSQTYTSKSEFNELEIGGRNLLVGTNKPVVDPEENRVHVLNGGSTYLVNNEYVKTTANDNHGYRVEKIASDSGYPLIRIGDTSKDKASLNGLETGKSYTFSFDAKWLLGSSYTSTSSLYFGILISDNRGGGTSFSTTSSPSKDSNCLVKIEPGVEQADWEHFEFSFILPENVSVMCFYIRTNDYSSSYFAVGDYFEIANMKLETGNKATDWTPATEDMATSDSLTEVNNELTDSMNNLQGSLDSTNETVSGIQNTQNETVLIVEENKEQITSLIQRADGFTMEFETVNETVKQINDEFVVERDERYKYIKFIDGEIWLGKEVEEGEDDFKLVIRNDRISFLQNNVEVAYLSNNKLYVTDIYITGTFRHGNFVWQQRANGNYGIRYVSN